MSSPSPPRTRPDGARRLDALGTTCGVIRPGADAARLDAAEAWIRAMHRRLSRFEASSELSALNRAAGRWTAVSRELAALLGAALDAYRTSGGLVHAGVLGPMLATGYRRPLREGPLPADERGLRPPPPLPDMLRVERGRAWVAPGTGIDLGGIAKGWMADRLALRLGGRCLVNLGGDLRAVGPGWPIGMGGTTIELPAEGGGAATSSTRRRRWEDAGRVMHHLVDPRTGRPCGTGVSEVSVVAGTALDAEVLAKTALLLGPERGLAWLSARALAWRVVR